MYQKEASRLRAVLGTQYGMRFSRCLTLYDAGSSPGPIEKCPVLPEAQRRSLQRRAKGIGAYFGRPSLVPKTQVPESRSEAQKNITNPAPWCCTAMGALCAPCIGGNGAHGSSCARCMRIRVGDHRPTSDPKLSSPTAAVRLHDARVLVLRTPYSKRQLTHDKARSCARHLGPSQRTNAAAPVDPVIASLHASGSCTSICRLVLSANRRAVYTKYFVYPNIIKATLAPLLSPTCSRTEMITVLRIEYKGPSD
ncbi:hypothetical protein GGI42DRAFT_37537 [Trichoderma sp. SZMC 28013]